MGLQYCRIGEVELEEMKECPVILVIKEYFSALNASIVQVINFIFYENFPTVLSGHKLSLSFKLIICIKFLFVKGPALARAGPLTKPY